MEQCIKVHVLKDQPKAVTVSVKKRMRTLSSDQDNACEDLDGNVFNLDDEEVAVESVDTVDNVDNVGSVDAVKSVDFIGVVDADVPSE